MTTSNSAAAKIARPTRKKTAGASASQPAKATARAQLPRVLLTGFEPFGESLDADIALNPSWSAVKALQGKRVAGHLVTAAQLPCVFNAAIVELKRLLCLHKPALVICVGQAGGRPALSLERVAINVDDARIPDNAGRQPVDQPVAPDGPAAYFSTLPIKAMRQALQGAGLQAEVSQTAGTYVCNHVFYGLMHSLATLHGFKRTRGGFVHVPFLPEQGSPNMSLEDQIAGLRLMLACALVTHTDVAVQAGATH